MRWKCFRCGYLFEGDPLPPDRCPGCKEACTFIDTTCYIPECGGSEEYNPGRK